MLESLQPDSERIGFSDDAYVEFIQEAMMESDKLIATNARSLEVAKPALLGVGYERPFSVPIERESTLRDYWMVLLKRKWIGLAFLVTMVTLATIITFRMPRLYTATTRVEINRENQRMLGLKDAGESSAYEDLDYNVLMETQLQVLKSDALAVETARKLADNKDKDGGTLEIVPINSGPTSLTNADEWAMYHALTEGVKVSIIPQTRILQITAQNRDPKLAAMITNTMANTFIERNFRARFDSIGRTTEWLQKELGDLQLKIEVSQDKLVRYQREHGILGIDEKQNVITAKLDELNRNLTAAETERIRRESNYKLALSNGPETNGNASDNTSDLLGRLRSEEANLEEKYAQVRAQLGDAYPKSKELQAQLEQVRASIRTEEQRTAIRSHAEYLAALKREELLGAAFEAQKQEANKLNESAIQYNLLKRDLDTNRQLYEGLLQRLKEAGIEASLKSSNISMIEAARIPTTPSSPNIPRNVGLSALVGIFGGLGLIFAFELLDNTVRTADQVQIASDLPVLGIVPMLMNGSSAGWRTRIPYRSSTKSTMHPQRRTAQLDGPESAAMSLPFVALHPKSEGAEAYRALRTSILLSMPGSVPKVIAITSSVPQEGKTTTAVNCATVLAQQGARVLLVDADLRRPAIHSWFGLGNLGSVGLSSLLTGTANGNSGIVPAPGVSNLFIVPAGPIPPHPSELLGSKLLREMLNEWSKEFDHIVIDTPPVLSVTDAVLVGAAVDSVLLVVRSGVTRKDALRNARNLLGQMNIRIMGAVVNCVDFSAPDQYYYYYGTRYYGEKYFEAE